MFKEWCIDAHMNPMRLDRYLGILNRSLTHGVIQKAIRAKKIILNGSSKLSSGDRVTNGDVISVHASLLADKSLLSEHRSDVNDFSIGIKKFATRLIDELVILNTDDFFAIDKPSKIACQGGSKISLSIDAALKFLNHQYGYEYRLVHRIDKETSGILLIAKNRDAAITLTKAFADRIIKKEYIAILHGVPCDNSGVIDIAIDGKSAHTEYDVLSYNGQYSIVSFLPLTGRMHQIRVHASSLGCPIVGDKIYNNVNDDSEHMMLHAYKIYVPALFATRDQKAHDQKNCDHKMIAADISKDMKKFIELSWKNNSELKKIQKIFL